MQNNISLAIMWILDIVFLLWAASHGFPPLALMFIFAIAVIVTCSNKSPIGGD